MTKYELRKNTREIRGLKNKDQIVKGCTLNQMDQDPEIIKEFLDLEEALEELRKPEHKSYVHEGSYAGGTLYTVTEYYVEENHYDKDDEWEDGGDVIEFAEFEED